MTSPTTSSIELSFLQKISSEQAAELSTLKGGGGGGTYDDMEPRVSALEATTKRIDEKLDKILDKMAGIETDLVRIISRFDTVDAKFIATDAKIGTVDAKVSALPSAESFGYLRGRIDSLPTISKVAGLLAIAVAAITIINNWQKIVDLF